jgi:hypothetical protein
MRSGHSGARGGGATTIEPPLTQTARAWAILFLSRVDRLCDDRAFMLLAEFIDEQGAAHTYLGESYGCWADAHPDVTPVVGLALTVAGAPAALIQAVRDECLRRLDGPAPPTSFWWTTPEYAIARTLEFLERSGGTPGATKARVQAWLSSAKRPNAAFSAAQALTAGIWSQAEGIVAHRLSELLESQQPDGSWAAAPVLRVPEQLAGGQASPGELGHADRHRLFTTAGVVMALKLAVVSRSGFEAGASGVDGGRRGCGA